MAYDIILGRDSQDKKKFGDKGLIYLGKGYVKMGQYTSLSNKIWLDVARSHVVLVAGKRGSGKSYTLGTITEELANLPWENARNISSLIFDTMGIFWTMKYENKKDQDLLKSWDLESKKLPVKVFIPFGKAQDYQKKGIPFDEKLELKTSEIEAEDWLSLFNLDFTSMPGILIEKIITHLKEKNTSYSFDEINKKIESDQESSEEIKEIVKSLFYSARNWGIFSETGEGTKIEQLISPGTTTVIDISTYSFSNSFNVRASIISLISKKIFKKRMDSRKQEELSSIIGGKDYLSYNERKDPLIWMFIDEAHEFLPKEGKTPASEALIQLLREGRQPGISLVLATQQPGQIHKDVMTQSDIVISHRVTSKQDLEALNEVMQSYMLDSIKKQMDLLPSEKGSAIILDDNSERIYPIRIRPRFTWHGGESPISIKPELNLD